MKKILIIFSFFIGINNIKAINASSYIIMNMDNNQVIESYNEKDPRLIASITKIMTI